MENCWRQPRRCTRGRFSFHLKISFVFFYVFETFKMKGSPFPGTDWIRYPKQEGMTPWESNQKMTGKPNLIAIF